MRLKPAITRWSQEFLIVWNWARKVAITDLHQPYVNHRERARASLSSKCVGKGGGVRRLGLGTWDSQRTGDLVLRVTHAWWLGHLSWPFDCRFFWAWLSWPIPGVWLLGYVILLALFFSIISKFLFLFLSK